MHLTQVRAFPKVPHISSSSMFFEIFFFKKLSLPRIPSISSTTCYSWPSCRADTARGTAVPCWHGTAPCRGVPPCRPCRAWPCHGPGLRPMTRHMGRFSVPCRPCATAILAVPCRPTAHQQKTLKINRKFQSLSSKLQIITCHRIIK